MHCVWIVPEIRGNRGRALIRETRRPVRPRDERPTVSRPGTPGNHQQRTDGDVLTRQVSRLIQQLPCPSCAEVLSLRRRITRRDQPAWRGHDKSGRDLVARARDLQRCHSRRGPRTTARSTSRQQRNAQQRTEPANTTTRSTGHPNSLTSTSHTFRSADVALSAFDELGIAGAQSCSPARQGR
jgi:hypothetical protein